MPHRLRRWSEWHNFHQCFHSKVLSEKNAFASIVLLAAYFWCDEFENYEFIRDKFNLSILHLLLFDLGGHAMLIAQTTSWSFGDQVHSPSWDPPWPPWPPAPRLRHCLSLLNLSFSNMSHQKYVAIITTYITRFFSISLLLRAGAHIT